MSAAQAVRSRARHRAQSARFLAPCHGSKDWAVLGAVAGLLLEREASATGPWLFLLDQTSVGQQGQKTQDTYHCGNRRRRPRRGRRYQEDKIAQRSGPAFVMGLRLSPGGLRIPCCRCYSTEGSCRQRDLPSRKQTELAAELIRAVAVPAGAAGVVLGDTASEAKVIRQACAARGFSWVVPLNPERVLGGGKPRPEVKSLGSGWTAEHFEAVRLIPGQGRYVARRAARCRVGPKSQGRTFRVHPERRAVPDVGDVLLVFSTNERPHAGRAVAVQKLLMTNDVTLTAAAVVALDAVRGQVELFFKELQGTLGWPRYRFREFAKVAGWVQACLVTFCYLEWYRAEQVRRRDLPEKEKRWWQGPRSDGLRLAVGRRAEEHDLGKLLRWSGTKAGLKRLRQALRRAQSKEYCPPA
jgi:hypothetical protein